MENLVKQTIKPSMKIHKFYLILAIFFGILMSVFMPFYSEPDGQYHFMKSTAMVGVAPDLSRYGEVTIGTGVDSQKDFYKNGEVIQEYFQNKVVLVNPELLPRGMDLTNFTSYTFSGHIIPAIGAWVGYHISPTLGMMNIIGRLFSTFIYSIGMYFIIKFLKYGKLFFATVALSPVILGSFASFSYDSLGFILVALLSMICINAISEKRITGKQVLSIILLAPIFYVAVKPNLFTIFLFAILSIIYCYIQEHRASQSAYAQGRARKARKIDRSIIFILLVAFGVGAISLWIITSNYGGVLAVINRLVFSLGFRFYFTNSPGDVINVLASLYPTINYIPTAMVAVWGGLVLLILLQEKKFHDSSLLSLGAFLVILLGVLSTYIGFLGYGDPQQAGLQSVIQGVQGRYLTPFLLLLVPLALNKKFDFTFKSLNQNRLLIIIALVVSFSHVQVLLNTLYALLNL
ncbi:MAG: DUF2142 domain-containing protein [Streptococcaceae bacterium]|jgi:hypothetical protein|nr:DUF2142 domain-containing protein [Streptococcaceae bacterium]